MNQAVNGTDDDCMSGVIREEVGQDGITPQINSGELNDGIVNLIVVLGEVFSAVSIPVVGEHICVEIVDVGDFDGSSGVHGGSPWKCMNLLVA